LLIILALVGAGIFLFNRNQRAWEVAAGAPAEAVSGD